VWSDPATRHRLAWYRAVAENRRPAKFRIASLADNTTVQLVTLTTIAFTMGWGMSFSLLFARLTGILHARASIHQQ
jgi:hypothetical protein